MVHFLFLIEFPEFPSYYRGTHGLCLGKLFGSALNHHVLTKTCLSLWCHTAVNFWVAFELVEGNRNVHSEGKAMHETVGWKQGVAYSHVSLHTLQYWIGSPVTTRLTRTAKGWSHETRDLILQGIMGCSLSKHQQRWSNNMFCERAAQHLTPGWLEFTLDESGHSRCVWRVGTEGMRLSGFRLLFANSSLQILDNPAIVEAERRGNITLSGESSKPQKEGGCGCWADVMHGGVAVP